MNKLSFVVTRGTDMSFLVSGLLLTNPNLSFDYKDTIVKKGLFQKVKKRKYVVVGSRKEIDELENQLKMYSVLYW